MGKTINDLKVGDKAFVEKTISETDVYLFAGISGDLNPAHINQVKSEKTIFKGRIAHGILVSGLISAVLGMQLPGPGTIYLGQELKFVAPVKIGDTVRAEVEVIEIISEKNRIKLKTTCSNQEGKIVISGEALVMPPKA
ncbi:3-hydroxybutyryl-CoA dehydratase [Clostridium tetanomorphum]|uniref:MaoC family dehydratase n=1 Tax=Clostridium tetanomorphum TaxID=1553 RepID=A0A923EBC9_CLOTT|nr:MaoC family dehydratase [Clostridium tetanomorphum]KAJ49024.1 dehydratase [Clostridium tetanomorphum DSM 665]KAJ52180.1 dehydratase [Clostridium tetanomorphum DSM 665]MBC2399930.1 MaoC family dehydratase [Clostridium tetanomorphum]MBP1866423.1 3-hydroxybutyryl-CoA dehydratase [Clostridium tetanomorphum]NRS86775.1 3-hydroxybutyryl-CoA dehydratase [Clostridium tetanomorphum]